MLKITFMDKQVNYYPIIAFIIRYFFQGPGPVWLKLWRLSLMVDTLPYFKCLSDNVHLAKIIRRHVFWLANIRLWAGLPGFHNKPTQLLLKTSPIAFWGVPLVKHCVPGCKIHVSWRGFPGKICIAGAKYHVIGVALTCRHEKQPTATVLK